MESSVCLEQNFHFKTNITDDHVEIILQILKNCLKKIAVAGTNRQEPVLRYRDPQHLSHIFSFNCEEKPRSIKELLVLIDDFIDFSVKSGHPRYFYQFSAGLDVWGLVGTWLIDLLNVNTFTYECAPVFTLLEKRIVSEVGALFGYPASSEGIFCPGGSLANGFAMNLARYYKFPNMKTDGITNFKRLIVFVSEDAHYSVYKMASFTGIGAHNVVPVQVDERGRMDVKHLRELLQVYSTKCDCEPFVVIATAGTTVLGAFDPLDEIADVCESYGLWLHVDAAWGGSAILSTKYKQNLKSVYRSDSFVWNPSKTLAIPQHCSILCVRHRGLIQKAHCYGASYLYREKFYNSEYDLGDAYLQCGRKPDVFKFWLMWKIKGLNGLQSHIDELLNRAEYLTARIRTNSHFELVCEPSYINVCFWYIPQPLRNKYEKISQIYDDIREVAPTLQEKLLRTGTIMINSQPLRHMPNFFRFVCCNSSAVNEDCDFLLSEIENAVE